MTQTHYGLGTMSEARTDRIRDAFGAAAQEYEAHAHVQRIVAETLAQLAQRQVLSPQVPGCPRILEIGCGTGLLTRELRTRFPGAELVVTDLSPAMVNAAGADGMVGAQFLAMDGEAPVFDGSYFDLIISSLAFQWFGDLAGAVARLFALLRPGGTLMFSTMAQRSFAEWRDAHRAQGIQAGTPDYPSLGELQEMLAKHADAFVFDEEYVQDFGGARGLHRHLKGIGATVPVEGRTPFSPAILRHVMRAFDDGGGHVTYHVAFGRVTRLAK